MADEFDIVKWQPLDAKSDDPWQFHIYKRTADGFDNSPIASCASQAQADILLALLRFQSAMTPEMWAAIKLYADDIQGDDLPRLGNQAGNLALLALNTLRQELQQP